MWHLREWARSLINSKNKVGPRTDPWGTPEVARKIDDLKPLYVTEQGLLLRYDPKNFKEFVEKPKSWSLLSSTR